MPCRILTERLFDVLAVADIFLSKPSSTIRWGVFCDVDVILFDFWGFDLASYQYLDCIDVVQDIDDMKNTISLRLHTPQDRSATFKKLSRDILFDGNGIKRYADLIDEVVASRRSERA